MRRSLFVLSFLFIASCGLNPEDYEREPNIFSLFSTDSSQVSVLVGQTAAIGDTISVELIYDTLGVYVDPFSGDTITQVNINIIYSWNGVEGAAVFLGCENQNLDFSGYTDSSGNFCESVQVERGDTWFLEVVYPDGDTVFARTTVPDSFPVTYPQDDTIDYGECLVWEQTGCAVGYGIALQYWFLNQGQNIAYVDSSKSPLIYLFDFFSIQSDACSLSVHDVLPSYADSVEFYITAFDSCAWDYLYFLRYTGYLNHEDYLHIPGAWGVFGSSTTIKTKRFIVKYPQPDTGSIPLNWDVDK